MYTLKIFTIMFAVVVVWTGMIAIVISQPVQAQDRISITEQPSIDVISEVDDTRHTLSMIKLLRSKALETYQITLKVIDNRTNRAFVSGDTIAVSPPGSGIAAIFKCGGDFHGDGTCSDVIASCATVGLEFDCNHYDDQGVCTNGGC